MIIQFTQICVTQNHFDFQVFPIEYEPMHNIKVVKGAAMRRLPKAQRKKTDPKHLKVTFKDAPLKDSKKLVDLKCGKCPIVVSSQNIVKSNIYDTDTILLISMSTLLSKLNCGLVNCIKTVTKILKTLYALHQHLSQLAYAWHQFVQGQEVLWDTGFSNFTSKFEGGGEG